MAIKLNSKQATAGQTAGRVISERYSCILQNAYILCNAVGLVGRPLEHGKQGDAIMMAG